MQDRNPENRDPITGQPGSHPVATGVGALGGTMTGQPSVVLSEPL